MVRLRDIGVIVIALSFAFFHLEWNRDVNIILKWTHPFSTSSFANGHTPNARELLPPPIVTDLEGDGRMEVILVTPDITLKVFSWHALSDTLVLRSEVSLLSKSHKVKLGRRPVALNTGYLDPYQSQNEQQAHGMNNNNNNNNMGFNGVRKAREQVIVVMTESWHVLCFDAQLNLKWETTVDGSSDEMMSGHNNGFWFHREATILVTSVPIHKGDRGSVFVGGRMVSDESLGSTIRGRSGLHSHSASMPSSPSLDSQVASLEGHFSFFALEGGAGKERWRHGAHDFLEEDEHGSESRRDALSPEHSQVLHVLSHLHGEHLGEVHWTVFKDSILEQLPHRWTMPSDSRLELARFKKERRIGGRPDGMQAPVSEWGAALPHFHHPGLTHGGYAPHSDSEHVFKPNVLVVHAQRGVEILHLYSGRTLCTMPLLQPPISMFADINGDGLVDRVFASQDAHHHESGAKGGLSLLAEAAFENSQLWNVTVKTGESRLGWNAMSIKMMKFGHLNNQGADEVQEITAAPPVGFPSSWRLRPGAGTHSNTLDTLILLSDGRVLSIQPEDGRLNWATATRASKTTNSHRHSQDSVAQGGSAKSRFIRNIFEGEIRDDHENDSPSHLSHSSIHPFSKKIHTPLDAILAIGESIVVLSPNGKLVTETPLHQIGTPISNPVLGDWNNDGYTDILIITSNAFYGYSLSTSQTSLVIPVLLGLLILLFTVLSQLKN